MKQNQEPEDARLATLLREARLSPPLPPRFQENVWRRISHAGKTGPNNSWLDVLAALILRPRFALVAVTLLVLAGVLAGVTDGRAAARREARANYLAAVAPASLR